MNILAAPLQEYTTAAFRNAHAMTIGGVQEYYVPFLRLENGQIPSRMVRDLAPENNKAVSIVPQILAKSNKEAVFLINYVASLGYKRLDFNFCCPFPKVTQHGYGAGILANTDAIADVLSALRQFPSLHFSAKLRLGNEEPDEVMKLLPLFNDFPFCHLVLHPRTARQQYVGSPDKSAYWAFASQCNCPVFYNGDIRSKDDGAELEHTMIGRGLLENPILPLLLQGETIPKTMLADFYRAFVAECQNLYQQPLLQIKLLWDYFLPGADKKLKKHIKKARTITECAEIPSSNGDIFDCSLF